MSICKVTDVRELYEVVEAFGKYFYEEKLLPGKFDASHFISSWENYFKVGIGTMWVLRGNFGSSPGIHGGLGALLYPDHYSGDVIASEAFWFVAKEHRGGTEGVRLIITLENWAREVGATRVMMAHIAGVTSEKLETFYGKRGYKKSEVLYVKEL